MSTVSTLSKCVKSCVRAHIVCELTQPASCLKIDVTSMIVENQVAFLPGERTSFLPFSRIDVHRTGKRTREKRRTRAGARATIVPLAHCHPCTDSRRLRRVRFTHRDCIKWWASGCQHGRVLATEGRRARLLGRLCRRVIPAPRSRSNFEVNKLQATAENRITALALFKTKAMVASPLCWRN